MVGGYLKYIRSKIFADLLDGMVLVRNLGYAAAPPPPLLPKRPVWPRTRAVLPILQE